MGTKTLIFAIILFISSLSFSKDITYQSGDWENGSTWVKTIEPTLEDTIIIDTSDYVEISSQIIYNTKVVIIVKGTLILDGSLSLPNGSIVLLKDGKIETYNNTISDEIIIGNVTIWSGIQGNLQGVYELSEGGVLPVTWGTISTYSNLDNITINWSTHSELNNDLFLIEQSSDLIYWEVVDEVSGSGTTNNTTFYTSNFYTIYEDFVYIRITQIDYNGDFKYSNIVCVEVSNVSEQDIYYFVDLYGNVYKNQPKGFCITIYKSGEKRKTFLK